MSVHIDSLRRRNVLQGALDRQIGCMAGSEDQLTWTHPDDRLFDPPMWHINTVKAEIVQEYITAGVLRLTDPGESGDRLLVPVDDAEVHRLLEDAR